MKRPPPAFNQAQSSVLLELYDNPSASYTTYALVQILTPNTQMGTPNYEIAFNNTRAAIEELIVLSLVSGKRQKGADGILFSDLKLTSKGEKIAIQERRKKAEFEKAMPEIIKDHNAVVEQIRKFEKT